MDMILQRPILNYGNENEKRLKKRRRTRTIAKAPETVLM